MVLGSNDRSIQIIARGNVDEILSSAVGPHTSISVKGHAREVLMGGTLHEIVLGGPFLGVGTIDGPLGSLAVLGGLTAVTNTWNIDAPTGTVDITGNVNQPINISADVSTLHITGNLNPGSGITVSWPAEVKSIVIDGNLSGDIFIQGGSTVENIFVGGNFTGSITIGSGGKLRNFQVVGNNNGTSPVTPSVGTSACATNTAPTAVADADSSRFPATQLIGVHSSDLEQTSASLGYLWTYVSGVAPSVLFSPNATSQSVCDAPAETCSSCSSDCGTCPLVFSTPINVSGTPLIGKGFAAVASVAPSTIYVIWQQHLGGGEVHIMFTKSTDGGVGFSPAMDLTALAGLTVEYLESTPSVAANAAGQVFVATRNQVTGEVLFRRSLDGGSTFSLPISISTPGVRPVHIIVAADTQVIGTVYVTYNELATGAIKLRRSTDAESSFLPAVQLPLGGPAFTDVATGPGPGAVSVVASYPIGSWETQRDIFFIRSADSGVSFSPPVNVSNNPGWSEIPATSSASTGTYAIWRDCDRTNSTCPYRLLFSRSLDSGATFSIPVDIFGTGVSGGEPDVDADNAGNVYVVAEVFPPVGSLLSSSIGLRRSSNGGATFGPTVSLSSGRFHTRPAIHVDSDRNVTVAWEQDGDIYLARAAAP